MALYLSHISAYELIRNDIYARAVHRQPKAPRYSLPQHGTSPTKAEGLQAAEAFGLSRPIHVAVRSGAERSKSELFCCHVLGQTSKQQFLRVEDNVYVACPEAIYLQMSKTLSEVDLIKLGCELCSKRTVSNYADFQAVGFRDAGVASTAGIATTETAATTIGVAGAAGAEAVAGTATVASAAGTATNPQDVVDSQGTVDFESVAELEDIVDPRDRINAQGVVDSPSEVDSRSVVGFRDTIGSLNAVDSREALNTQDTIITKGRVDSWNAIRSQDTNASSDTTDSMNPIISQSRVVSQGVTAAQGVVNSWSAIGSKGEVDPQNAINPQSATVAQNSNHPQDAVSSRAFEGVGRSNVNEFTNGLDIKRNSEAGASRAQTSSTTRNVVTSQIFESVNRPNTSEVTRDQTIEGSAKTGVNKVSDTSSVREQVIPSANKPRVDNTACNRITERNISNFTPRMSLTDPKKIKRSLQGSTSGIAKARRVLKYVLADAYSPMEITVALLLSLPIERGGYGLNGVELNGLVVIDGTPGDLRGNCFCDMLWRKERVVLEYDSEAYHHGEHQLSRDSSRRIKLQDCGYKVFSVRKSQVYNLQEFERTAEAIRKALGRRKRSKQPNWIDKHWELRKSLGNPIGFSQKAGVRRAFK